MKQVINTSGHVGKILQSARKAAGLTQAAAAARLGLSQSRLSQLEASPDALMLGKLLPMLALLGLEMVIQTRASAPAPSRAEW